MLLEELPTREKISISFQFGQKICRADCPCCGGKIGIRRAFRKPDNSKPKRKEHRKNPLTIRVITHY